jgi:hypothetical protein
LKNSTALMEKTHSLRRKERIDPLPSRSSWESNDGQCLGHPAMPKALRFERPGPELLL